MGWAKLALFLWQEMFDEYQRGLAVPGTPIRTFRLRVLLFAVVEVPYSVGDPFTPEEIQDGRDFFARSRRVGSLSRQLCKTATYVGLAQDICCFCAPVIPFG